MKLTAISLFIFLLLISGCSTAPQKELTTTLPPARDITENLSHSASGQDKTTTPPLQEILQKI